MSELICGIEEEAGSVPRRVWSGSGHGQEENPFLWVCECEWPLVSLAWSSYWSEYCLPPA